MTSLKMINHKIISSPTLNLSKYPMIVKCLIWPTITELTNRKIIRVWLNPINLYWEQKNPPQTMKGRNKMWEIPKDNNNSNKHRNLTMTNNKANNNNKCKYQISHLSQTKSYKSVIILIPKYTKSHSRNWIPSCHIP